MELTEKYPQKTIDRKVMFVLNKIKKSQLAIICNQIDLIDYNRLLDGDEEVTIMLMALKKMERQQLAEWKRFRTENGLSNAALPF